MTMDDLKHAQRERLIFLDRCLTWRGAANRKDLLDRFGISTAQAALDFRVYLELAGGSPPVYDATRKAYIAASNHQPLAPCSLTAAFDILVAGNHSDNAPGPVLPRPGRKADPRTIARLFQALQSRKAVHLRYTSMSSDADDGQWIAPTRFTSDGESVYIRGYSYKHCEYRNYLPIRIEPESTFDQKDPGEPLPPDHDWLTRATIWLRPRAGLSDRQAQVVRREFGFEGEWLRVETRKALEFFFDHRWGLDTDGARLERARTEYTPIPAD